MIEKIGCVQHDCCRCQDIDYRLRSAETMLAETLEAFSALLLGRKMTKKRRVALQRRMSDHFARYPQTSATGERRER